jgi:hypothetical protein
MGAKNRLNQKLRIYFVDCPPTPAALVIPQGGTFSIGCAEVQRRKAVMPR